MFPTSELTGGCVIVGSLYYILLHSNESMVPNAYLGFRSYQPNR
jgi:hypothetical protein